MLRVMEGLRGQIPLFEFMVSALNPSPNASLTWYVKSLSDISDSVSATLLVADQTSAASCALIGISAIGPSGRNL